MEWITLYGYTMMYITLFSSCTITALSGHMAWYNCQRKNVIRRLKYTIIDGLKGAFIGAIVPALVPITIYSYLFDRDFLYNKLYNSM